MSGPNHSVVFHRHAIGERGRLLVESICNGCGFRVARSDLQRLVQDESDHLLRCQAQRRKPLVSETKPVRSRAQHGQ